MKITFDENTKAAITYSKNNININPKMIIKWGYLDVKIEHNFELLKDNEEIKVFPQEFIFDCHGGSAIEYKKGCNT